MAGHDVIYSKHSSTSVEGLPTKHAAKRAVVLPPHLRDDGIHGPPIQLIIGEDFQRHIILLLVPFHCLDARSNQVRHRLMNHVPLESHHDNP